MKASIRTRLGFWLERFTWLHPLLLELDGEHDGQRRYVNRVNGHLVMKGDYGRG